MSKLINEKMDLLVNYLRILKGTSDTRSYSDYNDNYMHVHEAMSTLILLT